MRFGRLAGLGHDHEIINEKSALLCLAEYILAISVTIMFGGRSLQSCRWC